MEINCIFCKIRDKIIPKEFTYEDEDIMVFPDIHPVKSVHLLCIPKKHIKEFLYLEDDQLLKKMKNTIQKMIRDQQLEKRGYKLVINGGGGQIINHLHIHLIGPMGKDTKI